MAEFEGNVLRPPGVGPVVSVANPEELLAATGQGLLKKGGTVKAGAGVLRTGEPLKLAADGKTYVKDVTPFSSTVALNYTAVDATTEDRLVNLIMGGVVNVNVSGIGASNASALATALGGTYYARFGYIKF